MGTRGALGVRLDGKDKVTYQQFDSYYSGVGQDTVDTLKEILADAKKGLPWLVKKAQSLKLVTEEKAPTAKQIEKLIKYHNSDVSTGEKTEWYSLLRDTQGKIGEILECGFAIDNSDFLKESLWCEYAYIVNLDTNELEVYEGFQKQVGVGRYAKLERPEGEDYHPVTLKATFPLDNLPDNLNDAMENLYPEEEVESERVELALTLNLSIDTCGEDTNDIKKQLYHFIRQGITNGAVTGTLESTIANWTTEVTNG